MSVGPVAKVSLCSTKRSFNSAANEEERLLSWTVDWKSYWRCSGTSEVIGSGGSNEAAAVLVTTCKIVLSHGLLKDLGGRGSIPRQGTSVRGYVSGYW